MARLSIAVSRLISRMSLHGARSSGKLFLEHFQMPCNDCAGIIRWTLQSGRKTCRTPYETVFEVSLGCFALRAKHGLRTPNNSKPDPGGTPGRAAVALKTPQQRSKAS